MENSIRVAKEWLGKKSGYETYLEEKEWEAKEEGILEGQRQGLIEGQKETSKLIAKNMLNKKMAIEEISELTGLTKKEILNIK